MAVRPVEFQGMIQNTHEVTLNRTNEQQRPAIQQEFANTSNQQAAELSLSQVGESESSAENNFDPSKGGDGTGYTGNRNKKKEEEEKKKKKLQSEGSFKIKGGRKPFEISV